MFAAVPNHRLAAVPGAGEDYDDRVAGTFRVETGDPSVGVLVVAGERRQ